MRHFAAHCLKKLPKIAETEQVPAKLFHVQQFKKLICQSGCLKLCYYAAQYSKKLHSKKRESEQLVDKKGVSDDLH